MHLRRLLPVAVRSLAVALAAFACTPPTPAATSATTNDAPDAAAPAGPYVVMPVVAVAAPLLVADRRALQAKVHALISAQGAAVTKPEEVDALAAPEPTCRAQRSLDDRVRARWGRVPQVRVMASCQSKPCTIALTIERPPEGDGPWQTMDRFEAKVDAPETPAGWLAALDKLGPATASGDLALSGAVSPNAGPPTARAESVEAFGTWDAPPRATLFDFGACFENGWSAGGADAIRMVVGPDGTATQCEVEAERIHAHAAGARTSCYCKVASAVKFPPASAERRLEIRAINDPHATVDLRGVKYAARLQSIRASDGGSVVPYVDAAVSRLAACAAAAPIAQTTSMRLRLDVDAVGNVTTVAMDGTNDVLRACAGATLRGVALPCGRNGAYRVDGELVVWAQKL